MNETAKFEDELLAACAALGATAGATGRWIVAYSGGRDSSALLHALAGQRTRLPAALAVWHVDHGLQAASAGWASECGARSAAYGIPFESERLVTAPAAGESIEAWARTARHACFARRLTADDLLLTAHHADDQAETFLLNALRGSGPAGLRGAAPLRRLGAGWLGRPLLGFDAARIAAYTAAVGITPIGDPMNEDPRWDRVFLRQRIMPALRERWPAVADTLARTAAWQREGTAALTAAADLVLARAGAGSATTLPVAVIAELAPALQATVLRRWIARAGFPAPAAAHVDRMLTCVVGARADRIPAVAWKGVRLTRHAGALVLLPAPRCQAVSFELPWQFPATLALPGGVLHAEPVTGSGLRASACTGHRVVVRSRRGGERIRIAGRAGQRTLKHLLQEARVPPWQRAQLPLVYADGALVAVADRWVCAGFAAGPGEPGFRLQWTPEIDTLRA